MITILKYYKPYKSLFFSDLFFTVVEAFATLSIPLIVRYITSNLIYNVDEDVLKKIIVLGIAMLLLCIVILFSKWWTMYYGHLMGTYQERDMRTELYNHLQDLPVSYYDNAKVGSLLSRITSDLFEISELMHHGPENLIISVLKIIGSVIILSYINFRFAMITFIVVLCMGVLTYVYNVQMKKAYVWRREVYSDISAKAEDTLSGIRVVKSFANENKEKNDFNTLNNTYVEAKKIAYRSLSNLHSTTTFFSSFITVVIVIFGSYMIYRKNISISDLLTFTLYISLFLDPVKRLIDFSETFQSGMTGYMRFKEILDIKSDVINKDNAIVMDKCNGNISIENVYFKYRKDGDNVLCDINMRINSGEYIALCGFSGSGKTTLCSLLPRFYDVTSGSIKIDDIDIRDYEKESLRKNIGIVQQDTFLFHGNVIDNIRYGKLTATDEECMEAAKFANAYDFIMDLPNGFYTDIGERGVKLSGGQKQRISIARVFVKNPPILIFDEATSSLDNESESVIKESMQKLSSGRTTIVIAHRLSTIKNAKRIIVMNKFHIVEEGNHEELMKKGGVYKRLYEAGY